ncbi:large conductance mechanosensitive channel protein MscL [Mycoplasma struthionis]|uniref:MscL family protein n=1 Tax=Mycoplasma struthionis TaxID=538220 RepID=A0A3G8LFL7_9MOLU|nr:MscL family protein [Mycoplasma struthionis]AZG68406.1 MscL family protein [Mycoplasma struthionis]TPI03094.1 MscL family protein [Mycoplasma struthionis]
MTQKELDKKRKYVRNAFDEAKKVVARGNMFMLAIGLLLGASFGALVSSLANDVIMSAITRAMNLKVDDFVVWPKFDASGKVVGGIYIGKFLAALIQFSIVSAFIFVGLFTVYLIRNASLYFKAKSEPIEEEKVEQPTLTTEELILAELKKLNENLNQNQPKK